MNKKFNVVGIMVNERAERAPEVQEIITKYGSDVLCRLGVPSSDKEEGLITLIMDGNTNAAAKMAAEFEGFSEVAIKIMQF